MDERISIITPDHVELDFEPAGIGSRLLAFIIDQIILYLSILAIVLLLLFSGAMGIVSGISQEWSSTITLTVLAFVIFFLNWGYFLLFEALNKGQTPGKRSTGIRVVRDSGLPVGWRESALRNFVRIADIMPPPACFVAGLMILLSKQGKRLGDLLAGTMVVREDFGWSGRGSTARWEAAWIARAEKGRFGKSIVLADMKIEASQMQIIKRYLERRDSLPLVQRQNLAWKIASPFLKAMGEDANDLQTRTDRYIVCERVLSDILNRANTTQPAVGASAGDSADSKREQWLAFDREISGIAKGGARGLRLLRPNHLVRIIGSYRQLAGDVARARSLGRNSVLVRRLNNIAIRAHNVLYGNIRSRSRSGGPSWMVRFPIAVRGHAAAVMFSALMLFAPSAMTYVAVQLHPDLGYDLVPSGFLDFEPARDVSLHSFPGLARPVAASTIMTNNIQVTLLAFGLGMTAGLGTCLILISNGMQLGAVAGWMTARGSSRALWGWIMPHGGTELLAIVLSGAAGFMLAGALIAPGNVRRAVALRLVAKDALAIILGVMGMLVVAGLIEGFVSPSSIGYSARIAVLAITLTGWFAYLGLAGRK
ncbi:MAG TPA: stage II sporulation protein M [Burkholderiales bacterium]|nr:stage II sporulation protein M [Burkholderiales bacterium]